MAFWIVCFFVLFALAELFDWVKQISLPLPAYIIGGAFLAIASNYNKIFGSYFSDITAEILPDLPQLETPTPPQQISSQSVPISSLTPGQETEPSPPEEQSYSREEGIGNREQN